MSLFLTGLAQNHISFTWYFRGPESSKWRMVLSLDTFFPYCDPNLKKKKKEVCLLGSIIMKIEIIIMILLKLPGMDAPKKIWSYYYSLPFKVTIYTLFIKLAQLYSWLFLLYSKIFFIFKNFFFIYSEAYFLPQFTGICWASPLSPELYCKLFYNFLDLLYPLIVLILSTLWSLTF